jgi:hypothetical protein
MLNSFCNLSQFHLDILIFGISVIVIDFLIVYFNHWMDRVSFVDVLRERLASGQRLEKMASVCHSYRDLHIQLLSEHQ